MLLDSVGGGVGGVRGKLCLQTPELDEQRGRRHSAVSMKPSPPPPRDGLLTPGVTGGGVPVPPCCEPLQRPTWAPDRHVTRRVLSSLTAFLSIDCGLSNPQGWGDWPSPAASWQDYLVPSLWPSRGASHPEGPGYLLPTGMSLLFADKAAGLSLSWRSEAQKGLQLWLLPSGGLPSGGPSSCDPSPQPDSD